MDRRKFLQISFALGAALAGCGSSETTSVTGPSTSVTGLTPDPAEPLSAQTLFPGHPDPLDLTAPGERPPTEIPQPERFFGPNEPELHATVKSPSSFLDTFEYVVVVMFENRAFDHWMGYLYPGTTTPGGKPYNGAGGRTFVNNAPGPDGGTNIAFSPVPNEKDPLQTPLIDPAEQYQSLNAALFGAFNPPSNATVKKENDFLFPYNLPDGGAFFPPPMSGFALMFDWALRAAGKPNTLENVSTIMQGFTPNLIPAFATLAQQFAICDNWFCGVPSQTYCNRSMFNAASSAGFVNNSPIKKWPFHNTTRTIWDQMHAANVPWKIFYDALDFVCGTLFINYPSLKHYPASDFRFMYHFYDYVKAGTLPRYSWVQPRLVVDQNSYHPDAGAPCIKRGEILLNDIYQAIKQSNNPHGSNYLNTLLVITFDEGGTCFDHVPPPGATPPGDGYAGELGFQFDRHGQRIPTLLISPWLEAGTVVSQQLDATTIIRTLQEKFNLNGQLTARDRASSTLASVPFLSTPRTRDQMPTLRLRKMTAEEQQTNANQPLMGGTGPGIVKMANAIVNGAEDELPPGVTTVNEALAWMRAHADQLRPGGIQG